MSTTRGRGVFVTFEGLDGSGKSTQMRLLAERLRTAGIDIFESVEPGGTPIGRQIRRILLHENNTDLAPTAEMLLMFAARAQNVDQSILPALSQGKVVLSDRWTDSTVAYQGYGRGLGADLVLDVDRIACRGLVPNLTLCIDIDPLVGLARARARASETGDVETRMEQEELAFFRRVREGYAQIANDEPRRFRMIDGDREPSAVAEDVWAAVEPALAASRVAAAYGPAVQFDGRESS
jgi:dTMP kinase